MNDTKLKLEVEQDLSFQNLIETIKDIHEMEDISTDYKLFLINMSKENKINFEEINSAYLLSANEIKYRKKRHENLNDDFVFYGEEYGELKYGWKIVIGNLENVKYLVDENDSCEKLINVKEITNYVNEKIYSNIKNDHENQLNQTFKKVVEKLNNKRNQDIEKINMQYEISLKKERETIINQILMENLFQNEKTFDSVNGKIPIKKASELLGIKAGTIRTWEKDFDLDIPRDSQGIRYFLENDLGVLKYIKSLRDRHFSKSKIKELLDVDDFFDDYVYPYDEFRSCSIDDDDEDDCPTL